jgi:hypothetical protein
VDNSDGKILETNNQLEINYDTSASYEITSMDIFDFHDSEVKINIVNPNSGSHTPADDMVFSIEITSVNEDSNGTGIRFRDSVQPYLRIDGDRVYHGGMGSIDYPWYRIRESANTIYVDYSEDGDNWVNHTSFANLVNLSAVKLTIGGFAYEEGITSKVYLDNLNFSTSSSLYRILGIKETFDQGAYNQTLTVRKVTDFETLEHEA